MVPSCFSNRNTEFGKSSSSHAPQNLTTCTYQAQLFSSLTSAGYVTLTWSKYQHSHSLTIHIPDTLTIAISLVSPALSIFKSRPGSGSKSFYVSTNDQGDLRKVKVLWDFSKAKFSQSSAEPESGFYVAIMCSGKLHFFLGDLNEEMTKRVGSSVQLRCEAALVSRREHLFGHRSYKSRVELLGLKRDIVIECYNGLLKVKVDGHTCLVVKRLAWKFRGNERIFIGGAQIQFYWDVFNWVNKECRDGHGLFMFLVGEGSGAWPEMMGPEKKLMKNKSFSMTPPASLSPMQSCSSVLQWAEESSDGCRSSGSSSNMSCSSFRKLSAEQLLAAIPDILNVFALQIQNLYNLTGARTFWIHNTGPIGCLPSTLINLPSSPAPGTLDEYGCVKVQNNMAREFNKQLHEKVAQLRTQLPLAAITYVDVHAAKMDLIANSTRHGFADMRKICCGYFKNGSLIVGCGRQLLVNGTMLFGGSCDDPSAHISWDGVHYTEAANKWIADRIIAGSLSDPPMSITKACHSN